MNTKALGFQHPECYARALGGCSGKMTAEHYISESILELVDKRAEEPSRSVEVSGLAIQEPGISKKFGVGRLAAKILCVAHQRKTSPFDEAGKSMFIAMEQLYEAIGSPTSPRQRFVIDGNKLERWALKTFLGGLYAGAFRVSPTQTMKGIEPPPEWLDVLFNSSSTP